MANQAVILAAGESSRFWPLNKRHKSLLKIMGKPLILHAIEDLKKAGINDLVIIQGPKKDIEEELKKYDPGLKINYVVQENAKGMGNAVLCAKYFLQDSFFVLNAERIDAGKYIKAMAAKQEETKAELVLLGTQTDKPWLFGIADLDGDKVKSLVEKPEKGKEPSDIRVIGIYFLSKKFLDYLARVPEHQYAFEDALNLYMKESDARAVITQEENPSLKYPWDILKMDKILMDEFLKLEIKRSAQIAKSAEISDNVFVGENVKIFENAVIKGPCYIGDNCVIGNNAIVREYVNLENKVLIGANAEIVRSNFQEDAHTHSGYLGDSILSKGCRVGAGMITGNVRIDRGEIKTVVKGEKIGTGLDSLGVIAGENARFGISCNIMPGILVGSNSMVGPNSVVFENVADDTVFYTEFRSVKKQRI